MKKQYEKYTLKDFLTDKEFLCWKFSPTAESDKFWNNYIESHPQQKEIINDALRILNSIKFNIPDITDEELEDVYGNIIMRYNKKHSLRHKLYTFTKYAASIIIICLSIYSVYFINKKYLSDDSVEKEKFLSSVTSDTTSIKLYVGNKEFLYDEDADITFNETNGKLQVTNNNETEFETSLDNKIKTNKIIVPYGKRSTLLLSDGTKVYLNSGTTMTFPSQFTDSRFVDVEGEIYIEVKKDEQKPFIVKTSSFDVQVLGTTFNVSTYPSDSKKSVILVEGRVKVKDASLNQSIELSPNQMYSTDGITYSVNTVNTYNYTSWKDGILFFTDESLGNITRKLSRYYGVNISCDESLEQKECSGKLVLFNNLEDVLNTLADILPLKYNVVDNNINIIHKNKD